MELAKAKAEIAFASRDYDRRILGLTTAGLSEARQWAFSPDEDTQRLAIRTLQEVDSPDADAILKRMAQDANKRIADYAKFALDRKALLRNNGNR